MWTSFGKWYITCFRINEIMSSNLEKQRAYRKATNNQAVRRNKR